ncbi:MAG: TolC family protein [Pyrinomonadaceae bacterium]|nr:TolC family protein [Pyrinomonadaceae bacterium]
MNNLRHTFYFLCLGAFGFGLSQPSVSAQTETAPLQSAQKTPEVSDKTLPTKVDSQTVTETADFSSVSSSAAPNLNRVGIQTTQTVPISLNEAIRKALENNNDIQVAREDVRLQETQLRSLRGAFDPVFSVTPNYTRNASTGSSASNDFRVDVGLRKQIESGGGSFNTFFNNSQTGNNSRNNTNFNQTSNLGTTSSTTYFSNLGINFTQPLFRNFRVDNTRRQIKIQRRRLQQSDADFRRQTIEIISRVQSVYWDLVFALRNQQNQVANVNLARENLRQVEVRIKVGDAAPLARAEVGTELANREGELLSATQQVATTENTLKTLLLREANAPEWTQSFVPTDTPIYSDDPIIVEDALKDAIDNRPELRRLRLQREITAIDIDYFKNQVKPRIDLVSSFSLNGLALGNQNTNDLTVSQFSGNEEILRQNLNTLLRRFGGIPIPNQTATVSGTPAFFNGGTFQSFRNLFRTDAPNYSIGVTFEIPFRNTTAKANLAGARIQQEQTQAQTRSQEQLIVADVRNAAQAVETSRQRILTARRARENAEIQLEGERKLYEVGRSTTFLLFQRENALTNARNAEIRAETDYNKSLSDLQRATSTTFRTNNIEVDSPIKEDK